LEVGSWQVVAVAYVSYLAVASLTRRDFARARLPLFVGAAVAWSVFAAFGRVRLLPVFEVVVPSLVLLAGYWLSGLLFVRPDVRIERWLQSVDDRVLMRTGILAWFYRSQRVVQEFFELSYLLVYLAVPAGATTLVLAGHGNEVSRFWMIVLLAEFVCYGMLPWIQTRPPRVLESMEALAQRSVGIRRLNLSLVNRASIQVNTLPSGHAAGALATALAVGAIMPRAGIVFLLIALCISVATVLGRYHYVVDTTLGALVALAAWSLI
jgi:membrane-associated phospholipid phosphatase